MKGELSFRLNLRRAARLAVLTGQISGKDWLSVQSVLLNARRRTPSGEDINLLEEVAFDIVDALKAENKVAATATVEEINWGAILEFIKGLMPTIIEFINALLAIFKTSENEGIVE